MVGSPNFEELNENYQIEELLDATRKSKTLDAKYWELIALWKLKQSEEAIRVAIKYEPLLIDSRFAGDYLELRSLLHFKNEELDNAIHYNQLLLTHSRYENQPNRTVRALERLGFLYKMKDKTTTALGYFEEALAISEQINDTYHQYTLTQSIASILEEKNNLSEALDYYNKSSLLEVRLEHKGSNPYDIHIEI